MPSTISMTTCLGGKVQWGLGAGYHLMGARRRLALPGVVVASTTKGSGKISALTAPEYGTTKEGGKFYSMRVRCTVRVY